MSLFRPRKDPSLPQNDSAREQRKRADQLADARSTWVWTTEVETLPGVPLATEVPREDNPTIRWALKVVGPVLKVLENTLAVKLRGGKNRDEGEDESAQAASEHLEKLRASMDGWTEEGEEDDRSIFDDEVVRGALGGSSPREMIEQALAHIEENRLAGEEVNDLDDYLALFQKIEAPEFSRTFMQEAEFTRLRLAGPNAGQIEGIDAVPADFGLSAADYAKVVSGDTLSKAAAEGRLFLQDYRVLNEIEVPFEKDGQRVFLWAPRVLFARPPGQDDLVTVAIELAEGEAPVVAGGLDDWPWQIARTAAMVADGNYHELLAHLAWTHLVVEAFAIATHRQLAEKHPLYLLLLPHFEGTLFINNSAAGGLIAEGGPIDKIFAGKITSTQKAAANGRLGFDFYARMLPNDIERRKVGADRIPEYPYRDDALLVWASIEEWVREYVHTYYTSEDDLTGDTELAAWVADITAQGRIKGFRPITTREQLVSVLTMVIFTASAQHAAVNFPQQSIMTWAPGITGAGWAKAEGDDREQYLRMLPPIDRAQQQLDTLYLLGGVYYNLLGSYETGLLNRQWFQDPAITDGPLKRFRERLEVVETTIQERNRGRTVAYPYLLPSRIPGSINI